MASTVAGRRATERHRLAQLGVSRRVIARTLAVWPLLDVENLDRTLPGWAEATTAVIQLEHEAAVAVAAGYYREFRAAEAGRAYTGAVPAAGFDDESVRRRMLWAAPSKISEQIRLGRPTSQAVRNASAFVARYAQQITVDGARRTVVAAAEGDAAALGWARATSNDPCAFCAMQAARGPVFTSRATADFESHIGCACTPEPVYSRSQEWPPGSRRYREQLRQASRSEGDVDPLTAFRRVHEDRA